MRASLRKYLIVVAVALAVIAGAVVAYINQLDRAVSESVLLNIEEVSQHDVESIEASLDVVFDRLEAVSNRLRLSEESSLEGVVGRLEVEAEAASAFHSVYVVDEQGRVWGSDGSFEAHAADAVDEFFPEGQDRFVRRYDERVTSVSAEGAREVLVYGMRLADVEVGGVRLVALFATGDVSDVRNQVLIESFDGRSVSSVVNREGAYIINASRLLGQASFDNLYDALDEAVFYDGTSVEDVREHLSAHEAFTVSLSVGDQERRMLSFAPIEGTNWSFVMIVDESVFKEHANQLIAMTMVMLAVVVLVLVVMMAVGFALARRSVEANARAQARTDFLSNMSHEIRTPLNGIIGLNHLMARHLDDRDAMASYVQRSGEAAQYLLALVNDILDMSKLQAGKVDLAHERFSVKDVVESLCAMQREGIEARGIELVCRVEVCSDAVVGDEMRVKQVLMNILSNAAKFTPAGGRITFEVTQRACASSAGASGGVGASRVSGALRVPGALRASGVSGASGASAPGGLVVTCFSVRDTGCGMSPEFIGHIFDPFAQEHAKVERANKGTGLGMSISHLLATRMGGEIHVESVLGEGSCFTVELPLEVAKDTSAKAAERAGADAAEAGAAVGAGEAPEVDEGAAGARVGMSAGARAANVGTSAAEDVSAGADASANAACAPDADARGMSVLVAEDNELNAEILRTILEEEGMRVTVAADGFEAVAAFEAAEIDGIDVILMDAHMPGMDGYEAARAIRALDRPDASRVRIFACTASTFKEDHDRALESGMDDFLPKPIDVRVLLGKLKAVRS